MIPRRHIALAVLLSVFAVGLIFVPRHPPEPVYQGKNLTAWTEDIMGNPSEARGRAVKAIEHLGTNAVPHLVIMMRHRDSRLRVKIAAWVNRHSPIKDPFVPASRRQEQALAACWLLGPDAAAAVPAIAELLAFDEVTQSAARSLTAVAGAQAVLSLSQVLTNQSHRVRLSAINALGSLGGRALSAVPALRATLTDQDPMVRREAASALLGITRDPPVCVEALLVFLQDSDSSVRQNGAWMLGQFFGEHAGSAVPELKKLLHDPDTVLASAAAVALGKIDPQFAPADPGKPDPSLLHGGGPVLQNRPLAHWLEDLSARNTGETVDLSALRRRAEEVVAQAGANAVPLLLTMLACSNAEKSHRVCRMWGRNGFQTLGPAGKAAIPSLIALLNSEVVRPASPAHFTALALADIGPEAVGPSLDALRERDDGIRAGAACALGMLGQSFDASAAAPALISALKDSDRAVCVMAARALGQIGEEPAATVPALVNAFDTIEATSLRTRAESIHNISRDEVRREFAGALRLFGAHATRAVPVFLKAIREQDSPCFQLAPLALAGVEDVELAKVINALIALLQDGASTTRLTAARTLGGFGSRAKAAVPALKELALTWTGSKADPHAVALALKQVDPVAGRGIIPELIRRLQHSDAGIRRQAARMLGEYRPEARSTEAALKQALQDRDPVVRVAAAVSLKRTLSATPLTPRGFDAFGVPVGNTAEPIDAGLLLKQLQSDNVTTVRSAMSKISVAAGQTINGFGPDTPAIVAALTENLQHTNSFVAAFAGNVLERLGSDARSAAPTLLQLMQDHSSSANFRVLRKIAPEMADKVIPILLTRLADPNPDRRGAAARLLAEAGAAAHAPLVAFLAQSLKEGNRIALLGALQVFQQTDRLNHNLPNLSLLLAGLQESRLADRIVVNDPAVHAGLIRLLDNPEVELRRGAARALGVLGSQARPALPALSKTASQDPEWKTRGYAARAVRQIERAVAPRPASAE